MTSSSNGSSGAFPETDTTSKPALARLSEAGHDLLRRQDPTLYRLLQQEYDRQRNTLYMVAASSLASPSVLACGGMVTTSTTTEGYPGARYHAGCRYVDDIERLAIDRAKAVFGARYANVQPHSCTSANLMVIFQMLKPGETVLSMKLDAGGHLSHGAPPSVAGRYFNAVQYGVNEAGWLDYDDIRALAREHRPKVIICGASSYPRTIDYGEFRAVADEVAAYLLADISHVAGLVAAGVHPSPIDHAHFTTTSTYKQLFGPRGGLILMGRAHTASGPDGTRTLAEMMQQAVFPFLQGTPDCSAITAKAAALSHVATPAFRSLARRIVSNAGALAKALSDRHYRVITGGTDTHMVLIDIRAMGITGQAAEQALEACNIIVNRNVIPGDPAAALVTSGIRLGTNILSLRGMGEREMVRCAELLDQVLSALRSTPASPVDEETRASVGSAVRDLCDAHPVPDYPAVEEGQAAGTR